MSRVAVVVVTRNTREQLRALLDGVRGAPDLIDEVVVVDNDSTDGTDELLATRDSRPGHIVNRPGRGFAAGVNQGVRATSATEVCIVTASTRLTAAAVRDLSRALNADGRIAAVAPLVRGLDGAVQRHGLFIPRPLTALVVLLGLERLGGPFRAEAARYYGRHEPGPAYDVDNISGACLLVRRAAWDAVGEFDERFFLYCEDVDWSLRARRAGWRLRFVPDVEVRREKSLAGRGDHSGTIRLYYRSLRAFYRKHYGGSRGRWLWLGGAYAREGIELAIDRVTGRGLRY